MNYKFYCWSAYDPLFKGYQMIEDYFNTESGKWEKIPSFEIAHKNAKEDVSNHFSVSTHVLGSNDGVIWTTLASFGRRNPYRRKVA